MRDDSNKKKPKFVVSCTDDEGVKFVEARINGVVVQSVTSSPYAFEFDTTQLTDGEHGVLFQCSDIYGVPSLAESRWITADNTGPSFTFGVYGGGHQYVVQAQSVQDSHGITSAQLVGGVLSPSFNVLLTVAPYWYTFVFSNSLSVVSLFPFTVVATDTWGNSTTKGYYCYMDTRTTVDTWLACTVLPANMTFAPMAPSQP